jgi:hypothetical protein
MGKGTNTTTNQTTSAPNPQAAAAYSNLLNQAGNVASTPYQAYTGQLTAPVNSQQQAGISGINQNANFAQPAVNQAIGIAGNAAQPLTQQQIQQYQNPYTQDVVNATQNQFNNQNAQQQAGLTGNAISQGALGGNRVGVAQGTLAGQQQLAQAPVIAGLYNQSYQQGLSTAENQFQQNPLAAAGSLANFGISGQGAALSGAGAQLGAGTLEQQTQQAQDTANYGQYAQAQAYPFQTTQWLAGLDTGVGSQLGGTSSGATTAPPPNQTAQYAGLGLAAAGLFLNRGGQVGYANGGVVPQHMDSGGVSGTPWSQGVGWVPTMNITGGHGAPSASAPGVAAQPAFDPNAFAKQVVGLGGGKGNGSNLGNQIGAAFDPEAYGASDTGISGAGAYGGSSSNPAASWMTADDYGAGFKRGGVVGYADGGAPDGSTISDDFLDRFAPAVEQPLGVMPRGQALGLAGLGSSNSGIAPQPVPGTQGAPTYDDGHGPFRIDPSSGPTGNATALKGTGVAPRADDDEETPDEATPTSGRLTPSGGASGVAPAAGFTPPYQITPADYAQPARDAGSGFGFGLISPNAKSGLLSAGLGMLASRSPFLGNAIGEGGLAGLSAYGSAEEKDRKAQEDAQKLSLEAKQAANAQALSTYNVNHKGDMTDYQEAELKLKAAELQKAPPGYAKNKDGTLAYIAGGPHDPDTIAAETAARTKKGTEIDDDTVDAIAQRVAQGDIRAVIGLGRNPTAIAQIQKRVAGIFKEQGLDHEAGAKAILGNIADQAGRTTAERTQAGIAAKLAVYGRNVDNAIGVATQASADANRTQFTPVNVALNAFRANTGDPKIVALGQSLNTLTNEYARAIGSGHGTVHDKEQAETQLNQARSHDQLVAIMNIMRQEIQMTKKSMPEARQEMRELYSKPSSETMRSGSASPELPPAFNPPPGALPRQYNGKTYYYDPQTKQPYPGQ